jgi:hypothetical protein
MHLSIEPVSGVSFGANRIMQYGGGKRGDCHDLDNLFEAFFDPAGADNANDGLDQNDEFGNQLASLTSRINIQTKIPFSVYFEFAGEDTSQFTSHRLGNTAMQAGLFFPVIDEDIDLTIEYSEWNNAWYVNGIYGDGATNDGNVFGHYFGDQRGKGDAVAGKSVYLAAGWQLTRNQLARVELTKLDFADYSVVDYVTSNVAKLSYSYGFEEYIVSVDVLVGKTAFGENYNRFGLALRW